MNNLYALAMTLMVLRGIHLYVCSSIQVFRSFSTPDTEPSQIFVSFIVFNEADPLTASVTLFLIVKIAAVVERDMPAWRASIALPLTFHLYSPYPLLISFPGQSLDLASSWQP